MKTSQLLLGGGALLLLYSYARKTIAAGDLFFFPDRIHSFDFEGLTPVFVAAIRVQNTSNQTFTLYSLAGNVYCNDTLVGNAYSFDRVQQILPNSQGFIYITLRLMPLGLVNDLIKAFQNQNFTFNLLVSGQMNVDNIQIPLSIPYKIG